MPQCWAHPRIRLSGGANFRDCGDFLHRDSAVREDVPSSWILYCVQHLVLGAIAPA